LSWDVTATAFVGSAVGGGALVGMVVRRVLQGRRGGALSVKSNTPPAGAFVVQIVFQSVMFVETCTL
jgi:hypothetical protein